jgi:hypothetical protein
MRENQGWNVECCDLCRDWYVCPGSTAAASDVVNGVARITSVGIKNSGL